MPTVTKDILYPGDWHLPDGRVFRCSQEGVKHFAQRMQDMIADGLPIPGAWEHQDRVKPVTREMWQARNAEMVKLTFGHADAARVNAEGALEVVADLDDDDAKLLKKVKFVSPQIDWNYKDPRGKVWEGPSILHFAATSRPVQVGPAHGKPGQKPFALSSLDASLFEFGPVRLSLNGYEAVNLSHDDETRAHGMGLAAHHASHKALIASTAVHRMKGSGVEAGANEDAEAEHRIAHQMHANAEQAYRKVGNHGAASMHGSIAAHHLSHANTHHRESTASLSQEGGADSLRKKAMESTMAAHKLSGDASFMHSSPNSDAKAYEAHNQAHDHHYAAATAYRKQGDKARAKFHEDHMARHKEIAKFHKVGWHQVNMSSAGKTPDNYQKVAYDHAGKVVLASDRYPTKDEAHAHDFSKDDGMGGGDLTKKHKIKKHEVWGYSGDSHVSTHPHPPEKPSASMSQEAVAMAQDDKDPKKKKLAVEEPGDNGPDGGGVSDATTSNLDTGVATEDPDAAGGDAGAEGGDEGADVGSNVEPLTKNDPVETPAQNKEEEPAVSEGPHPMMAEAIDLAHKVGLHIGEDTTEKNFIDRFIVAAKTMMAANSDGQDQETPTEQAPPVVSMSQEKMDRLEQLEQKDLERRLDALLAKGIITKPLRDKLHNAGKSVSLSSETAPGRDALLLKVEAYEELPANKAFKPEEVEKVREVPLSAAGSIAKGPGSPPDQEEADAAADELAARSTGQWDDRTGKKREPMNGKH